MSNQFADNAEYGESRMAAATPARERTRRRSRFALTSQARPAGLGAVRSTVAWLIRLFALSNLAVIVWVWARDGGISLLTSVAGVFTSSGRLTGLLGAYLLLIQILLVARIPFMEWITGFDRLTVVHRLNGKVCLGLILAHVGLITVGYAVTDKLSLLAESSTLLRLYPGMIAALIGTVVLILVVVTSLVIVRKRLPYESWFLVHLLAYAGLVLGWIHQVPTGNDFVTNPTATAYWTALYFGTLALVILFRLAQPMLRTSLHGMRVVEVIEEGPGVHSIRMTGRRLKWLHARAGQFFLWRFISAGRWWESHPFSLSAAPDGNSLRITVKGLGNFSSRLGEIKPGTMVVAEGPFGVFTDRARTREKVALIAGGIGITAIRALLEELRGDVVLIYRAIRDEDVIFRAELDELAQRPGVSVHYVIGDHRAPGNETLMSAGHLRELIPDIMRREVFLCGPPAMMDVLEKNVKDAGVLPKHIHTERFAL